ncbi:MAG: class I SAM-dependent methyltransferase [Chloroflexi bacterium]|nr:class I SAM-dependent methyltransferase [Chloroflexota bacterium]OJW06818.1 MAG: ubiquinone biosynthesis methyltransferase UbiE [Chloroflexi bacterium 54-19]
MGFYTNRILPKLLNTAMGDKRMEGLRPQVLAKARGETLEIGFGGGLNLPFYPATVTGLTAVDVNPGMDKLARKVVEDSALKVDLHVINGEELPFADRSFDTVVSTWTLCSIEKIDKALAEVRRVLHPEGRFIFIEHGLSPDTQVQKWQHRLNPLQKKLAGNCHLNRPIRTLIENQGFKISELNEFYLENTPKYVGYFYQGSALPV